MDTEEKQTVNQADRGQVLWLLIPTEHTRLTCSLIISAFCDPRTKVLNLWPNAYYRSSIASVAASKTLVCQRKDLIQSCLISGRHQLFVRILLSQVLVSMSLLLTHTILTWSHPFLSSASHTYLISHVLTWPSIWNQYSCIFNLSYFIASYPDCHFNWFASYLVPCHGLGLFDCVYTFGCLLLLMLMYVLFVHKLFCPTVTKLEQQLSLVFASHQYLP